MRVSLVREAVHPALAAKVAFVVLAIMLKCDLLTNLKEVGQLGILCNFIDYIPAV